jgi:Fe-S-cluster-containing dehydrogenase component
LAKYGMVIDTNRCTGCYSCFLACRDEHVGNAYSPITVAQPAAGHKWINVREQERGSFPRVRVSYLPLPCLHCEEATCISANPGGAVYRREDGIVIIDPVKAVGQREIVSSCPHRVIFWNEAENVPQKCTFCAHLLDEGRKEPRCVEVCPTQALVFGDLADANSAVSKLCETKAIEDLHPEYGLKPSVRYIGLPKRFLTGEIVFADNVAANAVGVGLSLHGGIRELTTVTDSYGDFIFEGLEDHIDLVLRVEFAGYRPQELRVRRGTLDVGTIVMEPATL